MKQFGLLCAAGAIAGGIVLSAQISQIPEPRRGFGDNITPAYEGWFYNPDGSRAFLVGYYNRNSRQELDVPIGPNNHIEPGGPDLGQPTHFMPGRQWGMFVIQAPRDFKPNDSVTWTLTSNGQTVSIPFRLHADYVMSPFSEIAVGNTPPTIKFEATGKTVQGPIASIAAAPQRTATVGTPMELDVWAADDMKFTSGTNAPLSSKRPPVTMTVTKYRGPGKVTFDKARPAVEAEKDATEGAFKGKAVSHVTFSEAGDYLLHITANDLSGDGGAGFGCCWTTALVKVTVK
ncbi:MAG TPA: hypothetical protein VH583_03655 [Vicinamibacterales bacterium]